MPVFENGEFICFFFSFCFSFSLKINHLYSKLRRSYEILRYPQVLTANYSYLTYCRQNFLYLQVIMVAFGGRWSFWVDMLWIFSTLVRTILATIGELTWKEKINQWNAKFMLIRYIEKLWGLKIITVLILLQNVELLLLKYWKRVIY